ncbi:MAG: hypothetical protein PVJ83_05265 [Gammaproteobacteria bacterium]
MASHSNLAGCLVMKPRPGSAGNIVRIGMSMSCWLILSIAVLSAGCSTLPKDYQRTESTAFQDYLDTGVGQLFPQSTFGQRFMAGFIMILPMEDQL